MDPANWVQPPPPAPGSEQQELYIVRTVLKIFKASIRFKATHFGSLWFWRAHHLILQESIHRQTVSQHYKSNFGGGKRYSKDEQMNGEGGLPSVGILPCLVEDTQLNRRIYK